jgi:hypothetical protein
MFHMVGAMAALAIVVTKWAPVSTNGKSCVCHCVMLIIVYAFDLPGV